MSAKTESVKVKAKSEVVVNKGQKVKITTNDKVKKKRIVKKKSSVELNIKPIKSKNIKKTIEQAPIQEEEIDIGRSKIGDTEYISDYRQIMMDYDPSKNKSPPVLTNYEIPLMIGKRATQIAYGSYPLVQVKPGMTHIEIAEEELRQKKIPFMIRRFIGDTTEYWRIEDLEVNF